MSRAWLPLAVAFGAGLVACGPGTSGSAPTLASRQALTSAPEAMEFEAPGARLTLFREMALWSQLESGRAATAEALFPLVQNGDVVSAPGLDAQADLFSSADAGQPYALAFESARDRWPEDRRDGLQGLSEREAAELVARSLLFHWNLHPSGPVEVDRAAGAPYAAAYVNGILRINPAFIYLAAAASAASPAPANQ